MKKYYAYENHIYCKIHYIQLTNHICSLCNKSNKDDEMIKVNDLWFHSNCLTCDHCHRSLSDMKAIFQKRGKLYCKAHYQALFCNRCTACGNYITKKLYLSK